MVIFCAVLAHPARAETVRLRLQHFMSPTSVQHTQVFLPWAERVAKASGGRITVEVFPSMKLGGKPPELITQVTDGTADIVWTVAGYTPGRFPKLEVFELPWISSSRASATSLAIYEFYERHARDELKDVHVLAVWAHPSGVIMTRDKPTLRPDDLAGMTIRAPSAVIGQTLASFGAKPKQMPAPQVIKELEGRSIDGTMFPYEVIPTFKLDREVRHITEFAGHRGLYTAVFIMAMNRAKYEALDPAARAALDANSGLQLAAELGRLWDEFELYARERFDAGGGEVTFIKGDGYDEWVERTKPAIAAWQQRMLSLGIDGAELMREAQALMAKHTARTAY